MSFLFLTGIESNHYDIAFSERMLRLITTIMYFIALVRANDITY